MTLYVHSNYVLNKVSNSNDATHIVNNVYLTAMGTKQISMAAVYIVIIQKTNLLEKRDNNMKTRKVHANVNKLCSRKEWRLYAQ